MQHISDILHERQHTLFAMAGEKGSDEWRLVRGVRDDKRGGYPTVKPKEYPQRGTIEPMRKYREAFPLTPRHA